MIIFWKELLRCYQIFEEQIQAALNTKRSIGAFDRCDSASVNRSVHRMTTSVSQCVPRTATLTAPSARWNCSPADTRKKWSSSEMDLVRKGSGNSKLLLLFLCSWMVLKYHEMINCLVKFNAFLRHFLLLF